MQLTLSEATPLNATYTNEMGQAIYKVDTPNQFSRKLVATIRRIVPSGVQGDTNMRDQFGHLAQVEWHTLSSSTIRMSGEEIRTKDFFKMLKWGWAGSDAFTAPDGKEYKWKIGLARHPFYERFNRDTGGEVSPKELYHSPPPASLEISPAGEHIMDMIFVTFIYMEMIRKDQEKTPPQQLRLQLAQRLRQQQQQQQCDRCIGLYTLLFLVLPV
ncbi:hypothetical protein BD779DRAFT_1672370 [Infundibulicybe gibba]|nr:hypothetical protein BD779DRAFT_1672370 [Infundibulicybe gibba]